MWWGLVQSSLLYKRRSFFYQQSVICDISSRTNNLKMKVLQVVILLTVALALVSGDIRSKHKACSYVFIIFFTSQEEAEMFPSYRKANDEANNYKRWALSPRNEVGNATNKMLLKETVWIGWKIQRRPWYKIEQLVQSTCLKNTKNYKMLNIGLQKIL